ncbi:UDP-glucosyltransferase 2-like [Cydia splendana]|uniref:UDP-glucosyltransferase 2-like n=1 Tax=Cydia splendana TaxID=1100963 RepID=UPI00300C9529
MANIVLSSLVLIALLHLCDGYKILLVFPVANKSHNILGAGYVKHLLDAGHEVTYVTPFPTGKMTDKYHEVDLSKNLETHKKKDEIFNLKTVIDKTGKQEMLSLLPQMIEMLKMNLDNDNLKKFLGDTTQHFDAVISEWLFSDTYAGFATVYNCPLIWFSSTEPHWMVLKLVHEASNPAFNPSIMSTSSPPFSFVERATSLIGVFMFSALKYFYLDPAEKTIYEEYFGPFVQMRGRSLPEYKEVLHNGSLLLTNSHSSLSQPVSVPPNTKEISGYHIEPNPKPLPADLQKLMDEAKHGVIYFSMGSNAKSKDFPDELKQDFLKMFGTLKQTVLWKFEEQLPNLPKNVHILQWAPQHSILAHQNLRVFITHGGLLSTTETVFFGVPAVVMPYGLDQHLNAERAVNKGFALKVDLSYEMAGHMKLAIEEILSNPKYTERVKQLSQIYHDRPVSPGKELVHWVEHVVRTRGAPHLRSPALLLPWYQKMYLDLLAAVLLALFVVKLILKKLLGIGTIFLRQLGLVKSPVVKNKKKTKCYSYFNPIAEKAYKDIYGPVLAKRGRPLPSYDDVLYNASLVLADSHASLGQATSLPQNYKIVGGYHVETEVKPLPQELQTIMDNAEHGVVYFSMGSKLKSTDMPEDLKKRLLKMFGLLKYTVLWKYEEILSDIPENVHILKWAPQQSILAHPNCILFITHGGLLSTTESVHFGKPIIAIPVFGDQYINSKSAAHKGFAKVVELGYDLDKDLKEAIDEVTSNTRYSERAKKLSLIYHDRPVPPGKELVHWVEHVVRTRGAPHLRSPALMLPWYQKMYLDALALMMVAVAAVIYLIGKLCSSCKSIVIKEKKYL